MNKTYKLVWSKVRNAWVVTSEIAKGHGKESSSGRNGKRLKLAVMTAILGGCFMTAGISPVAADLTHDQQVVYEAVMTQLKASGKVELGGTTEDTTGIAIGKDSSTSHHMGVAIGEGAKTDNQGNVAIGHKSYSYDSGVAIGTEARADGLNTVAIGDRVTAKNPYSVAISTGKPNTDHRHKYTEAVNSDHATVLGDDSVVGKDNKYGIAIGSAALSDKSESGMAIGRIATVINSEHGIALGRQSEVKNSNGGIVVGPLSTVLNSNKGLAMGDTAHIEDSEGGVAYGPSAYVTDSSDNGVAIGGSTKVKKSFQGVAIGYSASVENAGGAVAVGEYSQANAKTSVAIGSNSRADVAAGQIGYLGDSKTDDVAWKSSLGAVSVGTASSRWGAMTRQITNLAAGTKDTDAVNVAQLKVLNKKADKNITDITDLTKKVKGNTTDITNINSNITNLNQKTDKNQKFIEHLGAAPMYFRSGGSKDVNGNYTEGNKYWYTTVPTFHVDFGDGLQAEEVQKGDKKRTLVTVNTDKLIDNINSNTTKKITNVDGDNIDLSKNTSITTINNKINNLTTNTGAGVHYFSVTSDKKAAGSNFDNDGAKGTDSMVIGIGSSSEAPNSTVLGNNNTLKRYHADQNGSSSRNNIVAGQNMEVEGAHNAVFGTDYQNNRENRKTMVAGKYNTVIGVGNLAGYTAEKDPQDRSKWIYSKVQGGSDSGNVVVGMNNTATRGSNVIGTDSEASSLGTSVGSDNKIIGDGDYGLALGSHLTVNGEKSVAIGSESRATADYTTAIGKEAIAEKENSIAFGNSAKAQSNYSVAFGSFATATARSGVALGSSSLANREKGALGYLAEANTTSEAWKATRGAISIGNSEKKYTRQITNLAAGSEDTDAVNVAQLKALNTKVDKVAANSTAYTVETKENNDNTTTVTIKSNKAGDKGTTVTVATKDIHITSGTYDKNTKKLTFTTNTNTTFDVDMNDVINAAAEGSVHYLSVKSSETGEGSNYKNDGAKAKGSIVLGVRSSSEGINGVVVGNDNKLTGTKNDQNNSVVIGTGLNVDGVHNIVVGTNYENYDQKETKVKGEQNTVIGNGNLVGYTAEKDPNDATKWKYTEVSTSGSDRNVVVGSCNTANGSSVAVGTSLEVEDLGRAFGSGNKVIGSNNGGGQWGLALGSNNTVKGEMAVSVGTGTNALGDYTVSIGSEAKTNATNSIAMGYKAETVKGWSAAIGSESKTTGMASTAVGGLSSSATVDYGAAFGSYSVAQRASGVAGYLANGQNTMAWISNLGAFSVGDDVKGFSRQITGVAAGSEDTDAVNVAQLKAIEKKIGTGGTNGKDGKSAYDIWLETQTDKTKTKQDFLDSLKGKDGKDGTGADIDIKGDTGSGVSVTPITDNAGKKTYTIGLSTKIKAGEVTIDGTKDKENITVGDVKINGEKGKGTITGLSNKTWDPNKIESGRAATEDQLKAVTQGMQNCMNDINLHMNSIGAHSAALAALHPLDFDPYNRSQIMAGVSTYKGQQAIALGIAHYSNENTLVHAGLSYAGESDLMANVGISYKFGSEEDEKHLDERNKKLPQYKDGPISSVYILQDEVKQLIEENNGMKKEIEELKAVIKEIQNKA